MNRDEDKSNILSLGIGEECTVNWFEEGGGVVQRVGEDLFSLDSVAQYGGFETPEGTFTSDQIDELIELVYSWT